MGGLPIELFPLKFRPNMIGIKELRRLNPQAWTGLLAQDNAHDSILVTAVEREELNRGENAFRYVLSLDGYFEPITLIGKETNVPEALFYGNIANNISDIAPHCWISHLEGNFGWVIHEEPYNNYLPEEWTGRDIERIIDRLVRLHGGTWDQEDELARIGFVHLLEGEMPEIGKKIPGVEAQALLQPLSLSKRIASWERGDLSLPSDHAIRVAGNLGLDLIQSAAALEKIDQRGGWPGVFEDKHRQAAADLLDDPMPILYPLSLLPLSLIHGNTRPSAWHLDLLGNCQLSNWRSIKIGPSIYDLICLNLNMGLIKTKEGANSLRKVWPITEETIIDSYILAMGQQLGSKFSPILARQALPAVETLYILTAGIPRLANWIEKLELEGSNWQSDDHKDYDVFSNSGYSEFAALRSYWSTIFTRFLSAYRSL